MAAAFAAPGIDDDDAQVGIGGPGIFDAPKDDRVSHRRVGAGDENALGA